MSYDPWAKAPRTVHWKAARETARLSRLARAYADRCMEIVLLRREIKRLRWDLETARRGTVGVEPWHGLAGNSREA